MNKRLKNTKMLTLSLALLFAFTPFKSDAYGKDILISLKTIELAKIFNLDKLIKSNDNTTTATVTNSSIESVPYAYNEFPVNPYDIANYNKTSFSGYNWAIKDSSLAESGRLAPNNNVFSDSTENVFVDEKGLHLKLVNKDGIWNCAEVINPLDLGYGKYTFKVSGRLDRLDPNVMFSMFLYKDDVNEIDIEFSKWDNGHNSQFVAQPYFTQGNMYEYNSSLSGDYTSYVIDYNKDLLKMYAYHGHVLKNSNLIAQWQYSGDSIPTPEDLKLRMNLYIREGNSQLSNQPIEIIIKEFKHVSYK